MLRKSLKKLFFVFLSSLVLIFFVTEMLHKDKKRDIFLKQSIPPYETKPNEVVINMKGRLGNNMFQYATAYAYAKRHGKQLKIIDAKRILNTFNIENRIVYNEIRTSNDFAFYETNRSFLFENEMYNSKYRYLDGYFQNENYFKEYRSDILKLFKFKNKLEGDNEKLALEIQNKNSVAVHIRRGDYLHNAKNDILSNHYYLKAMDYIAQQIENPYFYIFSDDTRWVKNNLKVKYSYKVVENNQGSAASHDMHLMSLCKHQIIANSTFSWWGAWLNENSNKIVVAPQVWLTDKEAYEDTKNVVPKDWIRIKEKADIAVVFMDEKIDLESVKKNFDKYFLTFDRKEYVTKDKINILDGNNFDYVFIVGKAYPLGEEVNYSIVPYGDEYTIYGQYNGKGIELSEKNKKDIIGIKGFLTKEQIKTIIESW